MQRTTRVGLVSRVVVGAGLLLLLNLCWCGFLATMEPGECAERWLYRAIFGAVGASCLVAIVRLIGWDAGRSSGQRRIFS